MNFRKQLSEAYKAGYNQGLQELQEGEVPTPPPARRRKNANRTARTQKFEGYHEGAHEMDEKALAELGRMVMAGMHEGEHEDEIEEKNFYEPFNITPGTPDFVPFDDPVQAPIGYSRRRDPRSGRR